MATLTSVAAAPGVGGKAPLRFGGQRSPTLRAYDLAFDSSYPAGGEDISAIWDDFTEVIAIWAVQNDATLADARLVQVDQANKKAILVTTLAAGGNVEATGNQAAVASVKLLALGY